MAWDLQPVLAGQRVRLEPLTLDHAPEYLAAADTDQVFRWMNRPRPHTLDAARTIIASFIDDPAWHPLAQIDVASGRLVGMTTFYDVSEPLRTLAIGATWLSQTAWGTGINRESKLLLLTHAFEVLDCVRVVWHVDNLNERSQKAVLALGATHEGVLRKHRIRLDGTWRDTFTFSMLDTEWPHAKATRFSPTGSLSRSRQEPA